MKKTIYYYTIENLDGKIYCGANKLNLAKDMADRMSNEGICYKRKVGDLNYKKFAFMW